MAKVLTRYNAFILDKPGYYSCPQCYLLTKSPAVSEVTCVHCHLKAPILPGVAPGLMTPIAIPAHKDFFITALSNDKTLQICKCPKCAHECSGSRGLYSWSCVYCGHKGAVSYREICNACLMNGRGLVKAVYLCPNPSTRHTAAHNQGLAQAGKCEMCHGSCCKKL